jgi:hypothetical protein
LDQSGQSPILGPDRLSAYDPKRTFDPTATFFDLLSSESGVTKLPQEPADIDEPLLTNLDL